MTRRLLEHTRVPALISAGSQAMRKAALNSTNLAFRLGRNGKNVHLPREGGEAGEDRSALGLYLCLACNHPLVFHKIHGGSEPCCLCPPDGCAVEYCNCKKYDGMKLTVLPHNLHRSTGIRWGTWGMLYFAMKDEQTLVNGAEPVVERVVINR